MRYVVAIDVGIKNLGLCVFDFTAAKFVYWDNVSLVPSGRYLPCQNVQYVRDFIKRFEHYFLALINDTDLRVTKVLHPLPFRVACRYFIGRQWPLPTDQTSLSSGP